MMFHLALRVFSVENRQRHFLVTGGFTGTWRDGWNHGVAMDGFYRSLVGGLPLCALAKESFSLYEALTLPVMSIHCQHRGDWLFGQTAGSAQPFMPFKVQASFTPPGL